MKTFTTKDYEMMISYLDHSMDIDTKELFESRLEEDPELFEEMQQVEVTMQLTRNLYYQNELDKLLSREEEVQRAPGFIPIPLWQRPRTWLIAASVAALLVLGGVALYKFFEGSGNIEKELGKAGTTPRDTTGTDSSPLLNPEVESMANVLISENLTLEGIPGSLLDEAEAISADASRKNGIAALEKQTPPPVSPDTKPEDGLYGGSKEISTTKPTLSPREEAYKNLLLGVGYLKEGSYQEALKVLNLVKEASLAQDVAWYRALALIKTGKNEQARAELEKITDSRYRSDAQALLAGLPE